MSARKQVGFSALDLSCFGLSADALLQVSEMTAADATEPFSFGLPSTAVPPGCAPSNVLEMNSVGGEIAAIAQMCFNLTPCDVPALVLLG
jgi:hypothetical protein